MADFLKVQFPIERDEMKKPRLAIIGAGRVTEFHVPAFREAGFEVTAICSRPGSDSAKSMGERHGIDNVFDGMEALLAASDAWDALLITVTTTSTLEVLEQALQAGVPVLVEKPVALRSADLEPYINRDLPVLVGYNRRFYRPVQAARQEVRKSPKLLGQLVFPETIHTPDRESDNPRYLEWFYSSVTNHGLDLARFVFGELQIQHVSRLRNTGGALAGITAILTAEDGHLLQFMGIFNVPTNFAITIDSPNRRFEIRPFEIATIYDGMEVVAPTDETPIRTYVPNVLKTIHLDDVDLRFKPGFVAQARTFAGFVSSGDPGDGARLEDAYAVLKLAEELAGETYPTCRSGNG